MVLMTMRRYEPEIRASVEERVELGQRLRLARKMAGHTLVQVADALGVVRESVSRWEAGVNYPTGDRLRRLAALYGVTVDWLLNGDAKLVRETPGIYETGELPPTEAEARLLREFLRFLRQQRRDADEESNQ